MLFNSLQYGAFLVIVVGLFWTIPKRYRRHLLLVASYVFYGSWDVRLLGLLLIATGGSWLAGRAIPAATGTRRTLLAAAGVAASLGVLAGFRLYGFFVNSGAVSSVPTAFGGAAVKVAIPVGLSFIAFQAISYVVDVYRGHVEPASSLLDFGLYVAFFPHLLAGPIMRANKLIPSFHSLPARPERVHMAEGAELILVGLFKKVALADPIITLVTRQATDLGSVGSANMWMMWMAGLIAAYFDITGYIDIARGSAMLLGITLQPNSIQPLLRSTNLADFWRRWQVTVMMWFRDYVYLPVRGRRKPTLAKELLALLVSFVALGVWHGTGLNWFVWGGLTGLVVTAERLVQTRRAEARRAERRSRRQRVRSGKAPAPTVARSVGAMVNPSASTGRGGDEFTPVRIGPHPAVRKARQLAYVFVVLVLTLPWIGSPTIHDTLRTYGVLLGFRGGPIVGEVGWFLVLAIVALLLLDTRERERMARSGTPDPVTLLRVLGYATMVVAIIVFSGTPSSPFLYFRF